MNLKERAQRGLPLDDALVIDANAHYLEDWLEGIDNYISRMDRLGIDKICCSSRNPEKILKAYPDRILANYRLHYIYGEEARELRWPDVPGVIGFGEIWPEGAGYPIDGRLYEPLWEAADSERALVTAHTWYPNMYDDPAMYAPLAERYPSAQIILVHAGGSVEGMLRSIELVNKYDNVYMELDNVGHHYREIEYLAKHADISKVLYGSDFSSEDFASHFGPILFARVSEEVKAKILGLNMKALLEKVHRYR